MTTPSGWAPDPYLDSTFGEDRLTAALTAAPEPGEEEEHTSVVVVALPAEGDPVHGIGPEEKHATILFFGSLAPDDETHNPLLADYESLIRNVVSIVAAETAPFTEAVTSVDSLGDDGARVWMLAGDALPGVRDELLDVDSELVGVLEEVEQYPSYTPHVTIGYPEPGETEQTPTALDPAVEEAAAAVESITFDRLAIWWAGESTEYALEGTASEEEPVEATLTAAPETTEGPALAQDIPTDGEPFYGILWPESVVSGDARAVDAGATTWRDLPLPVMSQDATAPGHDGAVRTGRIDVIERDESTYSVPVIRYSGVWDTSPAAAETMRQVDNRMVRGISVDGDAVTVELRGSDGQPLDPMVDDFPADGVVIETAVEARVSGGTVCSIPAFHQAYIANGRLEDRVDPEPGWNADGTPKDDVVPAPPEGAEDKEVPAEPVAASAAPAWTTGVIASASQPLVPLAKASAFANPGLTEPTGLTVTDDGRVYGHLAVWGICHIGIDGICQEPPVSNSNYAYFATGVVHTDAGPVRVGQLTMDTGHANMRANLRAAVEHYDHTGAAVADVAIGQDGVGIWFAGLLREGVTAKQVHAMRASGRVSGDWREPIRGAGELELCAALVVNVAGFPLPTPAVAASGGHATALVASGIVAKPGSTSVGTATMNVKVTQESVRAFADAVEATLERRRRVLAAGTRVRRTRAAIAAARLERMH